MRKILFTFNDETRDGYESRNVNYLSDIEDESVDEIIGENVIEKIPDLVKFIDECYRILKFEGKAVFTSPYYASIRAWISPLNIRGVSEFSLNFSSKKWREDNKYTEAVVKADLEVGAQFMLEEAVMLRADEVKSFWMSKYSNVVQAVMFNLTKKKLDEKK